MIFSPTKIADCVEVDVEKFEDERGAFARTWCTNEFRQAGIPGQFVQSSISVNHKSGTLRGMHCQLPPSNEGKLVRCVRGSIFDVAIDLRSHSSSYLDHIAVELNDENRRALYIPPGCAHGFQTLQDNTEILYLMTDFYAPDLSTGFRWNDRTFGIDWPSRKPIINERDAGYPDFDEASVSELVWA